MIHAAASLSECANLVRHICAKLRPPPTISCNTNQISFVAASSVGKWPRARCATHLNVQLSIAFDQAYVINSHVRG